MIKKYRSTCIVILISILFLIQALQIFAEPANLSVFRKAYPDVTFNATYDMSVLDWKIEITVPFSAGKKTSVLYWADGSFIPFNEMANKKNYWSLLYGYPKNIHDPKDFSKAEIEKMQAFGSDESRESGAGTPMFFFETLYDSKTQISLENHLVRTSFLGKNVRVHERLKKTLQTVESKIKLLATTDSDVKKFVDEMGSFETYYWRKISGTNRMSFHSLGIAIDIMPKNLRGKAIYWEWTKDLNPTGWMLTPLSQRWMPPQKVIDIFEKEGFIWGGKWSIWDNMHFEYHPELILYNYQK